MMHVVACVMDRHDLRLVATAALLCVFAMWTATALFARKLAPEGGSRLLWRIASATLFGSGVWATHFVAMLAWRSGLPITYHLDWTLVSVAAAIAIAFIAIRFLARRETALAGGAVLGFAIVVMHYLGMLAVDGPVRVAWDARYVAASIALGVGLSVAAIAARLHVPGKAGLAANVGLLVLAVLGTHLTGMSALTLRYDPTVPSGLETGVPAWMAPLVAVAAFFTLALAVLGTLVDRHLAQLRSREARRLHRYIAELEHTKAALERTSAGLSSALECASAANAAKSAFFATMSHELRTPLNAVIGFSEMMMIELLGPIGTPKYKEYVADIHKSGTHLLSLINDILDLSRIEAGKSALSDDIVSVAESLEPVRIMVETQANKGSLALAFNFDLGLARLRCDERRLKQVVLNLLSNAIKFTPAGGRVSLLASLTAEGLRIDVSDTGIGIAEADISQALEPFGQIDSSVARRYEGTGLGLPLAKQLMELHDGTLTIRSKAGDGTTVSVCFPLDRIVASERIAA